MDLSGPGIDVKLKERKKERNQPVLGIVTFGQLFYAHQVYKRTEPKMAIINDRMENKMALIHNFLSHILQEMVVYR